MVGVKTDFIYIHTYIYLALQYSLKGASYFYYNVQSFFFTSGDRLCVGLWTLESVPMSHLSHLVSIPPYYFL